jgi:ATP-dependent protease HslVU (ClpYQ) peptidase subunit
MFSDRESGGAFYGKAMAIADLRSLVAFLNRSQGCVTRKLREMLPKSRDDELYRDLDAMLASHEQNIEKIARSGLAESS